MLLFGEGRLLGEKCCNLEYIFMEKMLSKTKLQPCQVDGDGGAPSLGIFKARLGLEQTGIVEGVNAQGRDGTTQIFKGPFQPKVFHGSLGSSPVPKGDAGEQLWGEPTPVQHLGEPQMCGDKAG